MDPLALYIHWPFCLAKCPYCDFNSHVREHIPQARMVAALRCELAHEAARIGPRRLTSIFFGGGTPSLMAPQTVGAILDSIGKHWRVASDVEVTLEANPTSVEATRFRGYRTAGVNRVSLGVQALDDAKLKELGRLHTAQEALDLATRTVHHMLTSSDGEPEMRVIAEQDALVHPPTPEGYSLGPIKMGARAYG